jgi:hypothetical protein
MKHCHRYHKILAAWFALALFALPAAAKDIKLGGGQKVDKLPLTVVALPTIAVAIRAEDGGWRSIKIDAYVDAKDLETAKAMEAAKNIIITKADHEFPNRRFETLQSPEKGTAEAKKVIHAAVEAALGHPWKGDVFIRNMLVY